MSNYDVMMDARFPIKTWTKGVDLERSAVQQLINVANLPFIHKHIAVMPDCHWGRGATVGSVIATKSAIIPAAVGVDIGCGMTAMRTSLTSHSMPENLKSIRNELEIRIPVGFKDHRDPVRVAEKVWYNKLKKEFDQLQEKYKYLQVKKSPACQLGTLGGGNHFIELCLDEEDRVWIMLHSGSRGIGNKIASIFIEKAKKEMERHFISLPDKDLAYLVEGSEIFDDYVNALTWAQEYAAQNREIMMTLIISYLERVFQGIEFDLETISCHHNYCVKENHFNENVWVTRKGAVRAREGDYGIIPGSMGARSFIVKGKGNSESFHSCSHGAGRLMSRSMAKQKITLDQHLEDTSGVECRKDEGVLDESPRAYKNIDDVMNAQTDLVEIIHTLKGIMCIKG